MKKLIILIGAMSVAIASMALEKKFDSGYEYVAMPDNSGDKVNGVSLYKNKLSISKNDSTVMTQTPRPTKESKALSTLKYDGQFAYNSKTKTIFFSKNGSLFEYSEKTGDIRPLEIEGLSILRPSFKGSSVIYRRWRYKQNIITGLYNPAVSEKGDKIYFSAELKDGKGERDIWMITNKKDGTWSAPQNVSDINSEGNEDYPFLAGDSLLYFSSDRSDSLSGWNIYRSRLKGNQKVERLPEGINSNGDDYNFVGTKQTIYFVSDRNGTPDVFIPQIKTEPEPVDSVSADTVTSVEQNWELEPCTFYFEYDKDVLVKDYDKQIKDYARFMNENKEKKFVISGYTDARGGDQYNLELSQRRCQTIYKRLIAEGVDANQLKNSGHGKTELADPNANSEEKHLLNRRVEIKIAE